MIKPHLYRVRDARGWLGWRCEGGCYFGVGNTPREAYERWLDWMLDR